MFTVTWKTSPRGRCRKRPRFVRQPFSGSVPPPRSWGVRTHSSYKRRTHWFSKLRESFSTGFSTRKLTPRGPVVPGMESTLLSSYPCRISARSPGVPYSLKRWPYTRTHCTSLNFKWDKIRGFVWSDGFRTPTVAPSVFEPSSKYNVLLGWTLCQNTSQDGKKKRSTSESCRRTHIIWCFSMRFHPPKPDLGDFVSIPTRSVGRNWIKLMRTYKVKRTV